MSTRTQGIILLVVGILMILAVLLAAQLGLGSAGYGWKKIGVIVVGAIVFVVGLVISMRKKPAAK